MSGTEKQIQSGNETLHEKDPIKVKESLIEAEGSPIPATADPVAPNDSDSQGMSITNGSQTPPKNPIFGVSTPPRCDSPLQRQLITSPNREKPSLIVSSGLQALASEASLIPGADEISKTDDGNAAVKNPSPEVLGASVSEITPATAVLLQASASVASAITGAGELSKTEGGNASVKIPLMEVVEASVPGTIPEPEAEGGNVPGIVKSDEATSSYIPAEVVGSNKPEDVSTVETGSCISEPVMDAVRSHVLETIPSTEVVGNTDRLVDSFANSEGSDVSEYLPALEAKKSGISEAAPNVDVNVSEVLPSTTDNVPASVPPTESKEDGVVENMTTTKHSGVEEQNKIDNAQVHEPAKGSEEIRISEIEPHAKVIVDKSPTEQVGYNSEIVMDASVTEDHVPEIKKAKKSAGPPLEPLEETMDTSELPKSAATVSESPKVSKSDEMADKNLEPKCGTVQTSEFVEEAMEISDPEKPVAPSEESGQTSELAKGSAQTSKPKPIVGKKCEPAPESTKKATKISADPKKSATTAEESGQPSKITVEATPTSETKTVSSEGYSQDSKPPVEAMKTSHPTNYAATAEESGQASENLKEATQTSEPNYVAEGSRQANESVEEPLEKSDDPKRSSTTVEESGQASKEDDQASEPQPPAAEDCSQASKRNEKAMETSEPARTSSELRQTSKPIKETKETSKSQKSAATTEESRNLGSSPVGQVPEPTGEAIETSEPASSSSGSGQTSNHVEETKEIPNPDKSASTVKKCIQVPKPTGKAMETSEPIASSSGSGQTSKPNKQAKQEPGKIDFKDAEKSPAKKPAKGRLEDIKSDEPKTPKSPSRRSSRLQALQRTHSESPSPKKERRTVRSITLERVPSDDKLGVRTRGRRVGSTSSNSEMEGSGDEVKAKRVSRKDSKK